jgi:hypothetical protein
MKISEAHKMRFHGLRKLLTFHFAHLIKGVGDPFTNYDEIESVKRSTEIERVTATTEEGRILKEIQKAIDNRSITILKRVEGHKGYSEAVTDAYDEALRLIEVMNDTERALIDKGKKEITEIVIEAKKRKEAKNE